MIINKYFGEILEEDKEFDWEKATKNGIKVKYKLSDSIPDRSGDTINQDGWHLDNYNRNPVVLVNHDRKSIPAAKGSVFVEKGALWGIAHYPPEIVSKVANEIGKMSAFGAFKAVSIGMRPIRATPNKERSKDFDRPVDFHEQELLEWSIVTIPDNPRSVAEFNKSSDSLCAESRTKLFEQFFKDKTMSENTEIVEDEATDNVAEPEQASEDKKQCECGSEPCECEKEEKEDNAEEEAPDAPESDKSFDLEKTLIALRADMDEVKGLVSNLVSKSATALVDGESEGEEQETKTTHKGNDETPVEVTVARIVAKEMSEMIKEIKGEK